VFIAKHTHTNKQTKKQKNEQPHACDNRYLCNQDHGLAHATDRWGNTPYDDAVREGHPDCAKIISGFVDEGEGHETVDKA
jgi:hypothetical protein